LSTKQLTATYESHHPPDSGAAFFAMNGPVKGVNVGAMSHERAAWKRSELQQEKMDRKSRGKSEALELLGWNCGVRKRLKLRSLNIIICDPNLGKRRTRRIRPLGVDA
jgi:hypothetical protein